MRRSTVLALCVSACVTLLALATVPTPAAATAQLIANRPALTRGHFSHQGTPGLLETEPSLFGLPNYQADLQGMIQMAPVDAEGNAFGCSSYPDGWLPAASKKGIVPTTIVLTMRGGNCTFGQKALKAQAAGASAVIVYNNTLPAFDGELLPKMAGGQDTEAIAIPGFLIGLNDGKMLEKDIGYWRTAVQNSEVDSDFYKGVWMSLSYSLVAPDDRIEWDLYLVPDEPAALPLMQSFMPVVESIGTNGQFAPHFRIIDGDEDEHYCLPKNPKEPDACLVDNLPCGNQCTNCGKYCRVDPNKDQAKRPDGRDIVHQAAVQHCLYKYANETLHDELLWWKYVGARAALKCGTREDVETCTNTAMSQAGVPTAALHYIGLLPGGENCIGDLGVESDTVNDVMEEMLQYYWDWQPPRSPWLFVNDEAYVGSFTCGNPANPATCGPLSMMCQGFSQGTAPSVCSANSCDTGVQRDACGVCGGSATDKADCEKKGKSGSFPVGAVIGVMAVCCVLIGGAVYWYMRRQNTKMRDDIDSLLKQYLPLDGQQSLNSGNHNGIKSPSNVRDPNSNLRLIGNLDAGGDEPTDL